MLESSLGDWRGIYCIDGGGSWRHGAAESWRRMCLNGRAQGSGAVWGRGGIDGWMGKDNVDLYHGDGSAARWWWQLRKRVHMIHTFGLLGRICALGTSCDRLTMTLVLDGGGVMTSHCQVCRCEVVASACCVYVLVTHLLINLIKMIVYIHRCRVSTTFPKERKKQLTDAARPFEGLAFLF